MRGRCARTSRPPTRSTPRLRCAPVGRCSRPTGDSHELPAPRGSPSASCRPTRHAPARPVTARPRWPRRPSAGSGDRPARPIRHLARPPIALPGLDWPGSRSTGDSRAANPARWRCPCHRAWAAKRDECRFCESIQPCLDHGEPPARRAWHDCGHTRRALTTCRTGNEGRCRYSSPGSGAARTAHELRTEVTPMLVPDRGSPTLVHGVCGACGREPGHEVHATAISKGYAWTSREPWPGLVAPFMLCPTCAHKEAHDNYSENVAMGYAAAGAPTCCAGSG
jgi:hypothetical protein